MEIITKIKEVVEILDELDEYFEELPTQQSEIDRKISDIYHYIENSTMNSKNSYRVVKELKQILLLRRQFKQEQSILQTFQNEKERLKLATNRKMLLASVHKAEKDLDTNYKFRIYDEEEFIKQMEE